MRSLHQRTKEGVTWYPVRVLRDYIGTGERVMIEIEKQLADKCGLTNLQSTVVEDRIRVKLN